MPDVLLECVGKHDNALADILFVHGLGGDAQGTWMLHRKPATYWPQWVFEDLAQSATPCSVWALNYPAAATRWTDGGNAMALPDRATGVLQYLVNSQIGKRPIIFIAHSLGGLLVKYVLRAGYERERGAERELAERTLGVVFMATPHRGSNLASFIRALRVIRATVATDDLAAHSPYLNEVDAWYRNHVSKLQIQTYAVRENRKLGQRFFGLSLGPMEWVVDPTSADPNIPNRPVIPIDADHFEVCKPSGRGTPVYLGVSGFVTQTLAEARATPRVVDQDLAKFLGGVAKDDERCLCVLSSFEDSVTQYKTTSGTDREYRGATVSPEDTSAAVYLCSRVSKTRSFAKLDVMPSGTVRDEDQTNHLLLVGSSLTNAQTQWALSLPNVRYRFTMPDSGGKFAIECDLCQKDGSKKNWLANDGDETLDTSYEPGKATRIDYAIIERMRWEKYDIFVFAGLGPVGTKGAAYFMNQHWYSLYRVYGDRPFGVVLRFGTKTQRASFNNATVVHRTDPTNPEQCTEAPLG